MDSGASGAPRPRLVRASSVVANERNRAIAAEYAADDDDDFVPGQGGKAVVKPKKRVVQYITLDDSDDDADNDQGEARDAAPSEPKRKHDDALDKVILDDPDKGLLLHVTEQAKMLEGALSPWANALKRLKTEIVQKDDELKAMIETRTSLEDQRDKLKVANQNSAQEKQKLRAALASSQHNMRDAQRLISHNSNAMRDARTTMSDQQQQISVLEREKATITEANTRMEQELNRVRKDLRSAEEPYECSLCYTHIFNLVESKKAFLRCNSGTSHITCHDCFKHLVTMTAADNYPEDKIACPYAECDQGKFSIDDQAEAMGARMWGMVQERRNQVQTQRALNEAEERLKAATPTNGSITKTMVQDAMMELTPCCNTAIDLKEIIITNQECGAIKCSKCKIEFCCFCHSIFDIPVIPEGVRVQQSPCHKHLFKCAYNSKMVRQNGTFSTSVFLYDNPRALANLEMCMGFRQMKKIKKMADINKAAHEESEYLFSYPSEIPGEFVV